MSNTANPREIPLSDVTSLIQYGYTAKSSSALRGPRYLRITDIQGGYVDWKSVPRVAADPDALDRYRLRPGDIVFARSGATVGKSFLIRDDPGDALFASYLIRVRCAPGCLDPEYAALFFQSDRYWKQIREGASGIGQPNFNGSKLSKLRVPIRSIEDQRRVVANLNKVLARSTKAREELSRIPRLVDRYRDAILATAANGVLTADWRKNNKPNEDVAALLKTIQRSQPKGAQMAAPIRNSETLPNSWVYCRIGDVGEVALGRQRSPKHHSGKHMRPYLRVANVFENKIDVSDVMEMNFTPAEYERFRLLPQDILLNEGQSKELVGRPAMFMGELENVCFTNTLVRFRPHSPVSGEFALLIFRHYLRSGQFQKIANITTNIAHLGAGRFADLLFPLPPVAEQVEIVRLCSALLASLDQIESEVNRALEHIERLKQATLEKALCGELLQ